MECSATLKDSDRLHLAAVVQEGEPLSLLTNTGPCRHVRLGRDRPHPQDTSETHLESIWINLFMMRADPKLHSGSRWRSNRAVRLSTIGHPQANDAPPIAAINDMARVSINNPI